jgi:hypothetical protein
MRAHRSTQGNAMFTKSQLLQLIEEVPQSYWPPRPTRQDKATLLAVITRAFNAGVFGNESMSDIAARLNTRKPRWRSITS